MDLELQRFNQMYMECTQFLYREMEMLDNRNFRGWLSVMTEDMDYQVPLRITRDRSSGMGFSDKAFYFKETINSLTTRVNRFETEYAWAEDPPSRVRHFISNIRMEIMNDNEVELKSNLFVTRYQMDNPAPDTLCGERHDMLRKVDGQWKLARRLVLLDSTVLNTNNLSIFI